MPGFIIMKKILTAFLLFIISVPAMAFIVEGTIVDSQGPFVGAAIIESGTNHGNASDENGNFWITVDDPNAILEISSIGYETQRIKASDVKKDTPIVLQESYDFIEDVIVTPCTSEELHQQDLNASAGMWIGENARFNYKAYCKLTSCFDGFLLDAPNEPHPDDKSGQYTPNAKCIPCTEILPGSAENTIKDGKCFAKSCKCGYTLNNGTCIPWDENKPCTKQTKPALPANAKSAIMKCNGEAPYCEIVDCKDDTYVHNTDTNTCDDLDKKTCAEKDWNTIEHATGGTYERQTNGKILCKPTCDGTNYEAQRNSDKTAYECVPKTKSRVDKACSNADIQRLKLDSNTTKAIVADDGWNEKDGTVTKCIITDCKSGFRPDKDGTKCISTKCPCFEEWDDEQRKCVEWKTKTCDAPNAKSAQRACNPNNKNGTEYCKVDECNEGYTFDKSKNVCVSTRGADCKGDLPADSHASVASLDKNRKCIIMACEDGYNLVGKGEKAKCEARKVASEEEVKELKENAQKMEENKNSLVNRTIGAAGIGAVGIGGMMAAGALAEQAADQEAEEAMRAYLNTFSCEYGSNQRVSGGTIGIEIPGGNDMFNLYTQYAQLANDLKIRKAALGIKPGIESEVVIDKATTGLYDDVGTGITGGNYASVARALTDPNSEDAKRWNEQKDKTAKNLKTGAITAGVGAAASLAANLAVNSGKDKQDKTDEILSKYNRTTPDEKTDASSEETDTPSDAAVIPAVDEDQNTPTGAAQVGTFKENQNIEPVTDISPAAEVKEQDPECDPSLAWNKMRGNKSLQNRYAQYSRGIHQDSTRSAEQDAQLNKIKQICIGAKGKWEEKIQDLGDFAVANTTFLDCKKNGIFDTACLDKKSEQYKTALLNVCGTHNTFKTFICDFGSPDRTRGSVRCQNTFNKKTGNIEWTQTHASLDKLLQLSRTPVEQWRDKEDNYDACMFFTD